MKVFVFSLVALALSGASNVIAAPTPVDSARIVLRSYAGTNNKVCYFQCPGSSVGYYYSAGNGYNYYVTQTSPGVCAYSSAYASTTVSNTCTYDTATGALSVANSNCPSTADGMPGGICYSKGTAGFKKRERNTSREISNSEKIIKALQWNPKKIRQVPNTKRDIDTSV